MIDIGKGIPLTSNVEVYLSGLYSRIRADQVSLNEERLIVSTLDLALIVISIFDSHCMRVFLVLTAECFLVDPFAVVLTQTIEIHPDCSLAITYYSLRPLNVD